MGSDSKIEQHTSGIGVAATRREKAAMIDEVKVVNRMFTLANILTLSCQPLSSFHSRINCTLPTSKV